MSPTQAHHMLSKLVHAETFRTFIIRTVDRQEFEIEDPRRLALPQHPDAGTFVVYSRQELHIIGLDSIVSIEVAR